MPIKTSSCKAKGRLLQQWIKKTIIELFDLEEGDVESRSMGAAGIDVLLSPAARKKFPVSIESKNTVKPPAQAEIKQAKANAYPDTLSVVIWKPKGSRYDEALMIVRFSDFAYYHWRLIQGDKNAPKNPS